MTTVLNLDATYGYYDVRQGDRGPPSGAMAPLLPPHARARLAWLRDSVADEGSEGDEASSPPSSQRLYFGKSLYYWAMLAYSILSYILYFTMQTVVLKGIDMMLGRPLPWLGMFILCAAWPIMFLITYVYAWCFGLRVGAPPSGFRLKWAVLGTIDALHMCLVSVSVLLLPASSYMLYKSTGLLTNLALSVLWLKKKVTAWHLAAVVVVLGSMSMLAVEASGQDRPSSESRQAYLLGVLAAIASGSANALHVVYAKKLISSNPTRTGANMLGALELSSYSGMWCCAISLVIATVSGEIWTWPDIISPNNPRLIAHHRFQWFFPMVLVVACGKALGLVFKFHVAVLASALYCDILGVMRRGITIMASVLIFSDFFGIYKVLSMVGTFIGVLIYAYGGSKLQDGDPTGEKVHRKRRLRFDGAQS